MSSPNPTFPVPTQYWHTVGHEVHVPAERRNSVVGDPSLDVDYSVVSPGGGDPDYPARGAQEEMWPSENGDAFAGYGGLSAILNDADENGPLTTTNGAFVPQAQGGIYYEEIVCNALYNVKTWRLHGNVEGEAFNFLIPAGTQRDADDPLPSRPNGGKRAPYPVRATWIYNSDPFNARVEVRLGGFVPSRVEEEMNTRPVSWVLVPNLFFVVRHIPDDASEQRVREPHDERQGSLDANATILGQQIYTTPDGPSGDGTYPSYTVALEASEWWSTADSWYA